MNPHFGSADPPRTPTERLTRLHDNLQVLGERLKASIAGIVADAIADAVRDSIRGLLDSKHLTGDPYLDHREPIHHRDRMDDPWGEQEPRCEYDDDFASAGERLTHHSDAGQRWRTAANAALQAGLWFLRKQPQRRPVLTTLAVTLTAGITGFVAGPVLAAGAAVLASVASLLLTADASKSVAAFAAG